MLRVSEHYVSTQGEGLRTGVLTQFLRFAGCNMRCPGWPCDTPHAIFPELILKDSRKKTVDDIVLDCLEKKPAWNICWTGGEPFMQKDFDLHNLYRFLADEAFTIEVFTNGSFLFPTWAIGHIHFTMDWKLEGSGEAKTCREQRTTNALLLTKSDSIKFVIADWTDILEAKEVHDTLKQQGCQAEFWIGPAWGKIEEATIVEWLIKEKLNWKLNVQVHKYIWDPDTRGV